MMAMALTESVSEAIVTSRLLVLQSKRLLLASTERRLLGGGPQRPQAHHDRLQEDAERFRAQTETAQAAYRAALLKFGSPEAPDFWVITYTRLIEMATALVAKLRAAAPELPPTERLEVATDVEALEDAIQRWRNQVRASMAGASA
jgi:hypothetical protein